MILQKMLFFINGIQFFYQSLNVLDSRISGLRFYKDKLAIDENVYWILLFTVLILKKNCAVIVNVFNQ